MNIIKPYLTLSQSKVIMQGHNWLNEYVCSCGNKTLATKYNVDSGGVISCGCYKRQLIADKNTTHGLVKLNRRLYRVWKSIKGRCCNKNNSNWLNYGGRGITICKEWESDYPNFYKWALENGYESHLTIERINVNGNYKPSNCKWITQGEQSHNTRCSVGWEKVNYIRSCGKTTKELVLELGFNKSTINRIKRNASYNNHQ